MDNSQWYYEINDGDGVLWVGPFTIGDECCGILLQQPGVDHCNVEHPTPAVTSTPTTAPIFTPAPTPTRIDVAPATATPGPAPTDSATPMPTEEENLSPGPFIEMECLPNHTGRPLAVCPNGDVHLFGAPSYRMTHYPSGVLVESSYADGKPYIFFIRDGEAVLLDAPIPPAVPECLPDHAGRPLAVCPDGAVYLFGAPAYEVVLQEDGGTLVLSSYADGKPYIFIIRGDEVEFINW